MSLLSLYKKSSTFIHLAYLDHCPNVVVDAQAAGCNIICSSTGGTSEVVKSGKIIKEQSWDFSPIPLYYPPEINFSDSVNILNNQYEDKKNNIVDCSEKYYNVFKEVMNE